MNKPLVLIAAFIPIWLPSCQLAQHRMDVASIERKINTDAPDHEICSSFQLTKADVVNYFSIAREVGAHEFHYESMILPCKYQGSIKINSIRFQWEIFAGGSGYLYNDSIKKRYLCKEKCCDSLKGLC